jgi:formamidopyrimidine-DNA glycosylase
MPELPEVETMVAYMRERAIDGNITRVIVGRNPGGRYGEALKAEGMVLHTVGRRGKYIVFQLSGGLLVCHNAMSGYWDIEQDPWTFDYVEGDRKPSTKDVRLKIELVCDHEPKILRYHDSRLFGNIRFYPVRSIEDVPCLAKLGPEALNTENVDLSIDKSKREWNVLDAAMMFKRKVEIKHAMMDQEAVAGFGNIYAAEALYLARIDPFKKTEKLTTDEWQRLFEAGQRVLKDALSRKLNYSGLFCYRQKDCVVCEGFIQKKDLRGRSTYFCPTCQK